MDEAKTLTELLQLSTPPIAIAFTDAPPAGTRRIVAAQPASCSYWTLAAAGEVFYTDAADHKNCPVGAHTHGVSLSAAEQKGLQGLVETMVGLGYLEMSEVPKIPHRTTGFGAAVYAPLGKLPVPPDVVMIRGNARQLMLLAEASQSAGVAGETPTMGRPTCAILPQALASHRTSASFGCIGNRVYTGLTDGEAWFAVPGPSLTKVIEKLRVMVNANRELEKFHKQRVVELTARR